MNENPKHRDFVARSVVVLLALVLLAVGGLWFLRRQVSETFRLSARWSGDHIHVYSSKDGPWYVTHLVVYQPNGYWRAVAQLPKPITIIDSRGHHFATDEINTFEWVDIAGKTQAPPAVGEDVGVMYAIPTEGKRPPKN